MAKKKVASKRKPAGKAAPLEEVQLTVRLVLNTKKKQSGGLVVPARNVRSFVALDVPDDSTFTFDDDPSENSIASSSANWKFTAHSTINAGKTLIAFAKYRGPSLAVRPGFLDDTLNLDVTVSNQPDMVGMATIDHVEMTLDPLDPP